MLDTSYFRRKNRQELKIMRKRVEQIVGDYVDRTTPPDGKEWTDEEWKDVYRLYHERLKPVLNQLTYLEQWKLHRRLEASPLQVPDEYWYDDTEHSLRFLRPKGVAWATHELRKIRNAEIEFWFKLVVPVAALIISIIALVLSSGHAH